MWGFFECGIQVLQNFIKICSQLKPSPVLAGLIASHLFETVNNLGGASQISQNHLGRLIGSLQVVFKV